MNTEKTISQQLKAMFADLNISVTGHEIKQAEAVITYCKASGQNAYSTAIGILSEIEVPPISNLTPLKNALIANGYFKN